jgi:arylsulfatase A-like enzyme
VSQSLKSLFHLDGGSPKIFAELVQRLDYGVGRILNALDKLGLADNTIVVFTSDNGGERFSNEWPFIGSKGSVYEGSNRVPAILRWPGVLPKNKVSRQAAITFDWTATLLSAAKVSPPANDAYRLDGIDLLPYLQTAGKGESTISRQFFWRIGHKHAVRDGDLKYIKFASPDQVLTPGGLPAALRGTEFLFDLSQDPREQANLLEKRPDDVTRLKAAWDTWNTSVLPEPV